MRDKRISVCMATFNGELYIEEQLTSILNQLEQNDEIVISDDGSTDKTIEIIKSFKDPRIKIFSINFPECYSKFRKRIVQGIGKNNLSLRSR